MENNTGAANGIKELERAGDSAGLLALLSRTGHSPGNRRAAAKALENVARAKDALLIAAQLGQESDRLVRLSLVRLLGRLGEDSSLPILLQSLQDRDATVRLEAAQALARFNSPTAFEALLEALKPPSSRPVRQFAAEALGQLADRRAGAALIEALKDSDELVRASAATALGQLEIREAIPALKRIRHTTPHMRGADCAECRAIDEALTRLL